MNTNSGNALNHAFNRRAIQQVAENKIQQAIDQGEFDNLPGFGRPFEFDELSYDPNWWIRNKIEREQLKESGIALEKIFG